MGYLKTNKNQPKAVADLIFKLLIESEGHIFGNEMLTNILNYSK